MAHETFTSNDSHKQLKGVASGETKDRPKVHIKYMVPKGHSNRPEVSVARERPLLAVTNLGLGSVSAGGRGIRAHGLVAREGVKEAWSNAQQRFETSRIRLESLINEEILQNEEVLTALADLERDAQNYGDFDYEEKIACISNLAEIPEMSESRLVMLDRIAKNRNALAQACDLLEAKEFGSLAQGMIKPSNKNIARDVRKLKDAGKVIGLEWHGKTLYPSVQINPQDLSVYPQIQSLLDAATNKGCDEWDVLQWLMTDYEIPHNKKVTVGKPSGAKSLKDIARNMNEKARSEVAWATPLELLESGKPLEFTKLRTDWLGA